jgi:hypothetical protein
MRWAKHIEMHRSLSENLKGRGHVGDRGVDRRITLRWILQRQDV